jgi:hypothetical protein
MKPLEHLTIHQPLEWLRVFRHTAREEALYLINDAARELSLDATRDPKCNLSHWWPQRHREYLDPFQRRDRLGEMFRQRSTREIKDLEGADEARPIASLNPAARFGVHSRDHAVKRFHTSSIRHSLESTP